MYQVVFQQLRIQTGIRLVQVLDLIDLPVYWGEGQGVDK